VAKEVYEILGRPVSREQYEEASKKMDAPQSKVEEDMDDFAKRAKERAAQRMTPVRKAKGGSVSPSKKVLAKSGFYDKGKTKSEREKIVSKVTTKPQRIKLVEKMLSSKKMKSGGSVSARADGIAIRGKTKGRTV
jgi:hypothetical protein